MCGLTDDRWEALTLGLAVHDPFGTGLEDLEVADAPFDASENALFDASEKGDLASVKLLMDARGEDFVARFALSFHDACRTSLSIACAWMQVSDLLLVLALYIYC